jgi:flagellar motor switch protein FliN/FliY
MIAKGEVVVVDENYGVRVTDIITPEKIIERI